ncbi:hypothetical protein X474_13595 [Dethiosulfatarculus sandiegensis]|uniref:Uncharacterized protein n=1 Tax=Dethiosulfatarculus sandiegensis TaxID=1429043 RepID=A0A0D2J605_9BACT|nr:hypothetical protein X474_13595 [Dethiosulfatarculus sandiegensis]
MINHLFVGAEGFPAFDKLFQSPGACFLRASAAREWGPQTKKPDALR